MPTKHQIRAVKRLKNFKKQKEKYPDLLREVIRISDIVLEVLDARFIDETRNLDIEKEIKNKNKKIFYILNKTDLLSKELKKKKLEELELKKLLPYFFVSCKGRLGISKLRGRIKSEIKKTDIPGERAQIGIIGYPNTGKSSLINVLTGRGSAGTGAQAGFTKGIQKLKLTSDILILDTPGVIPEKEYSSSEGKAIQEQAKVGARTIDTIRDPELVLYGLMKDYSRKIEKFYEIDSKGNPEVFIEKLGKAKGFLKKGGVVEENRVCNLVIRDWQRGKIKL